MSLLFKYLRETFVPISGAYLEEFSFSILCILVHFDSTCCINGALLGISENNIL